MLLVDLCKVFNSKQRKSFYFLQVLVIVSSTFEIASVALIAVLMKFVANPESALNSNFSNYFYKFFNAVASEDVIYSFGISTLLILAISTVISIISIWKLSIFAHKIGVNMGDSLYSYYMRKSIMFHNLNNSAYLTKQISTESARVTSGIIVPLMQINARIIVTLLLVVMIFMYDKWAAIYGSLVFLSIYVLMYKLVRSKLSDNGKKVSETNAQRYKYMSEGFSGIRDITILGKAEYFIDLFEESGKTLAKSQGTNQVLTLVPRYVMEFVVFGLMVFLTIYLTGKENGIQLAFPILAVYAFSAFKLLPAFQQIYTSITLIKANLPAFDSIKKDLINSLNDKEKCCELPSSNMHEISCIKLEAVNFKYPNVNKLALRGINLEIMQGSSVGFVGHSGSGKSTVVDILAGFILPSHGRMYNGNIQINSINMREWQNSIAYVSQDIFLLDGTIVENITLGLSKNKVDIKRVNKVIDMVHLREYITHLPGGLETSVGERGVMVSGGQLQRIGIARALYRDSSLIIFDEATSALDGVTEDNIMRSIDSFYGEKTIVIVAHRLKTVKKCDVIYMLDKGRIVDQGTYDELVLKNKQFKGMSELA